MSQRQPLSLNLRLALAATAALLLFLAVAGLFLDRIFATTSEDARHQRLETLLYALLADTDLDDTGELLPPNLAVNPRLASPASGLYASIADAEGRELWRSDSAQGLPVLTTGPLAPGKQDQGRLELPGGGALFRLSFGVSLESFANPGQARRLVFTVAEDLAPYRQLLNRFRWNVAIGALLLALLFSVALTALLRWSQRPLRQVARDLRRIETGDSRELAGPYPRELAGLAGAVNRLVDSNARQLQRYRDALGDLSHSLKTPLAVLRGGLDRHSELYGQTERMQQVIDYHLERAASAGRQLALEQIAVAPLAERLVRALRKVYPGTEIWMDMPPELTLPADPGDLTELLGNLLDNACKYGNGQTRLSAVGEADRICLRIEDNGCGLAAGQAEALLGRGHRGDETAPGQGLGLGLVTELVALYGGQLRFSASEALGGLCVEVSLPG